MKKSTEGTKKSVQDSECSRTEGAVNEKEANFQRAPGHQDADSAPVTRNSSYVQPDKQEAKVVTNTFFVPSSEFRR